MPNGSNSDPTFSPTFRRIFCKVATDWPLRLASSRVVIPSNISTGLSEDDLPVFLSLGGTYGVSTGGFASSTFFLNFPLLGVSEPTMSSPLLPSSCGLEWKRLQNFETKLSLFYQKHIENIAYCYVMELLFKILKATLSRIFLLTSLRCPRQVRLSCLHILQLISTKISLVNMLLEAWKCIDSKRRDSDLIGMRQHTH